MILISRWTDAAEGTRFGAFTFKKLFITDAQSEERSYAENKAVFVRSLERDAHALADYRVFVVAFIPEQMTYVPQAAALRIQFGSHDVGYSEEGRRKPSGERSRDADSRSGPLWLGKS